MVSNDAPRKTPFSVDGYAFPVAGESGLRLLDFVRDHAQGLRTTAKSLAIRNAGPGIIYYMLSEDGEHWGELSSIPAGQTEGYTYEDGIEVSQIKVWASVALTTIYLRATPGRGD